MHECERGDFASVEQQVRKMSAREKQGEYEILGAPNIMRNDCANILRMFDNIFAHMPLENEQVRRFVQMNIVFNLSILVQTNLQTLRQHNNFEGSKHC